MSRTFASLSWPAVGHVVLFFSRVPGAHPCVCARLVECDYRDDTSVSSGHAGTFSPPAPYRLPGDLSMLGVSPQPSAFSLLSPTASVLSTSTRQTKPPSTLAKDYQVGRCGRLPLEDRGILRSPTLGPRSIYHLTVVTFRSLVCVC
jgi:hypothetical protein